MKKLILFIIAASMLCFGWVSVSAKPEDLSAEIRFSYEDDGTFLKITGMTPAKYQQHFTVIAYDPQFADGLNDILDENGELPKDPASAKPMTSIDQILRIGEFEAEKDGSFDASIPIGEDVKDGQYMIIQIAGAGKTPVSASVIRYYETENSLFQNTLPAFEKATTQELGDLLKEKQLLLGITLNSDYEQNKDRILSMFVEIRQSDFEQDAVTKKRFNSLNDVLKAWDTAQVINSLPEVPTSGDVANFVSVYEDMIDYDFSENNTHYYLVKDVCNKLAAGIFKSAPPTSLQSIKTVFTQAVGMAMLNSKDSTTIAPIVEQYAVVLGIDPEDYKLYCEKYSSYEVNKAFVGRDFKNPEQVVQALKDRVVDLEQISSKSDKENGKTTSPVGKIINVSGGGNGGSQSGNTAVAPKKFTDLTDAYWAYKEISSLADKGIISGFGDGSFRAEDNVTREQLVKIIATAFNLAGKTEMKFADVTQDRWSAPFIESAMANGVVQGVSADEFMPEAAVTRQDAAVMLYRVCLMKGIELSGATEFTDSGNIAKYAEEPIQKLTGAGVISGFPDGSFRPSETLTRGQAAKLIYYLLNR